MYSSLDRSKFIMDFLDVQRASIFNTYPGQSVGWLVRHTFGFPFCQRLWALKKHRDNIVVADIEQKVDINIDVDMEIQFGERVGHRVQTFSTRSIF